MAKRQHAMNQIADEGMKPVGKAESDTTMVQSLIPGCQAKGSALAAVVINQAINHAAGWTPCYRSLLELEKEGRAAFRLAVIHATAREKVAGTFKSGKPGMVSVEYDEHASAFRRSARVRL